MTGARPRLVSGAALQAVPVPVRASLGFAAVGIALLCLHLADLLGPLEDALFPIAGIATFVAIIVGVRRHRPAAIWSWICLDAAVLLFTFAGVLRYSLHTLGNVSNTRSLIPDYLALPGYALLIAGLLGFLFARRAHAQGRGEIALDGLIASLAVFSCAWVFLIEPLLRERMTPLSVQLVLIFYPAMSTFLVAIAFHLKYSTGAQKSTISNWLLSMMSLILIGDILYMLTEIHAISPASRFLDSPYILALILGGAISLHPNMVELSEPGHVKTQLRSRVRLVVVTIGLAAPAALFIYKDHETAGNRLVIGAIVLGLIFAAMYRIFRALEASMSSEARLSHQATHDLLTGLPNRALVQEYIEEAVRSSAHKGLKVAVLFLDLDRFKLVNDTHGHSHGDELLVEVAQRLRSAVRPGDLISRIGGDEFVIVLRDVTDLAQALELGERARASLFQPFKVRNTEVFVTASIGVTLAERERGGDRAEMMIRDADNAMYQAKAAGRNVVAAFDASMRRRVAERLAMEHDLRQAIRDGELQVHYQPIVQLTNGYVDGVEALVRWFHPTMGVLPPTLFIPIAEESGLIGEIGGWVLREACVQLAEWRRSVPFAEKLHVSVNLSASQIRESMLAAGVAEALAASDLPGEALHLEITESLLMEDPAESANMLTRLKALGIQLSIDDFGTGYSSLAYLQQFPVDLVKIDQTFVRRLDDGLRSEETLIPAMIAMARALKVKTIAEGVETSNQESTLRRLGCDFAQGYLYARPVPADEIPKTLQLLAQERRWQPVMPT